MEKRLRGKTERALMLYRSFVEALQSVGEFTFAPTKTRIGFQVRMIFAAVNRIGPDYVDGHLILRRPSKSRKFYRDELDVIHHFRIRRPEDIDEEFIDLMKEAYSVGRQDRPGRKAKSCDCKGDIGPQRGNETAEAK